MPDQISSVSLMSLTAQDAAINGAVDETSLVPAQVPDLPLSHTDTQPGDLLQRVLILDFYNAIFSLQITTALSQRAEKEPKSS